MTENQKIESQVVTDLIWKIEKTEKMGKQLLIMMMSSQNPSEYDVKIAS
jgi:hypothetical protein